MTCKHLLRPRCGCPADPPTPPPAPEKPKKARKPRTPWLERAKHDQISSAAKRKIGILEQIEVVVRSGQAQKLLDFLIADLARVSLSEYSRAAWHVVETSTRLEWGSHHDLLCTVLQALFEDWLKTKTDSAHIPAVINTAINCPPGTLKSKILSVFFPTWVWLRAPGTKFIYLCVNEAAAHRDARASRDLIRSDWYQSMFSPTWTLKGDQDAVSNYGNTAGGERLSQASGSEIVGLRGDFLCIDDANNPLDAGNKTERDKVNALWDDNQYTRVNDPIRSMRIGIQQRTHALDWTGNIVAKQGLWSPDNRNGWLNVVLPAEYETSRPPFELPEKLKSYVANLPNVVTKDWRTQQGETLHPKRMTAEFIAGEKRRWAGTGSYAGQMQQRPASEVGGKVKKAWFGWFRLAKGVKPEFDEETLGRPRPFGCHDGVPLVIHEAVHRPGRWDFDQIVISCDPAVKKTEEGSLWGALAIGYKGARRFVLDDRSDRREPNEAVEVLKDMVRYWKPDRILIEEKAGGAGMIDSIKLAMIARDVPMVTIEGVNPGTQDKELRLNSAIPTIANGQLFLLDGAPWVDAVVTELSDFPGAETDDRLDCVTQCINHDLPSGYDLPSSDDGSNPWTAVGL